MHHSSGEIERIIAKSINEQLTNDEQELLHKWRNQSEENELLYRLYHDQYNSEEQETINQIDSEHGWQLLSNKFKKGQQVLSAKVRPKTRLLYFRAAASIILVAAMGLFSVKYFRSVKNNAAATVSPAVVPVIPPGTSKASLVLADGSVIVLGNSNNGSIALQGNTNIIQQGSGRVAYQSSNEKHAQLLYNTLVTPMGGQYNIVLPDGSRVWLNAASSLRFPATFPGFERLVQLTGEAYFEVEHNSAKPFRVQVNRQNDSVAIEVLGTHFNVSSYRNEQAIATTLLQGSIRLTIDTKNVVIKPGQLANAHNKSLTVLPADTVKAIAWKNGEFQFDNDGLQTMMPQLERWYNIQVEYKGAIPSARYNGTISRSNNLSNVLKMLQESGLRFRLEGRKLIVLN
jgi:transmembrane sensor